MMGAAMNQTFERFPSTCGVMHPPFTDADSYGFGLYQFSIDGQGTFSISLSTSRTVPVGQDLLIPLDDLSVTGSTTDASGAMSDVSYGQQGKVAIPGGDLYFEWFQGGLDTQLLSGPALVHVSSFPTQDGAPLQLRLKVAFRDGRTLDLTARSPLQSGWSGCPAG